MLWIKVNKSSKVPLTRQIYIQIRQEILSGRLKEGWKIPSTRELSKELKISRNVVISAYELLYAEGYIESRQGAGSFISKGILLDCAKRKNIKDQKTATLTNPCHTDTGDIVDFKTGMPDLQLFPRIQWQKVYSETMKNSPKQLFGYGKPEGLYELRKALADYLYLKRGICCSSENIIITNGAAQGLSILSHALVHPGDSICLEDPCSIDIYRIFNQKNCSMYSLEVDQLGAVTKHLKFKEAPKLIYVTPSHQFPLGGTLPIQRRIELIQYARHHNTYIVEDDYDSEFRYTSPVISSLYELDPDRVIYIGTFSKTLSPALRIGYLILPDELIEQCRKEKWYSDLHSSLFEQKALAEFISQGHLDRQIRKANKIYKQKNNLLTKMLKREFSSICIMGESTGLHLAVDFQYDHPSDKFQQALKKERVHIYPANDYTRRSHSHNSKWLLGFGHLSLEEIEKGVRRIKRGLDSIIV
ncbi:PLP-dependent aminotransferase family protein [Bacillus subtilis]|uniref:MocR-like pyridoxine biosynthesis transcription factor PdxR n=2 Tax=Bacillaceae TaxID=186817 RepID=UPI000FFE152D|nr:MULTISPECIES: PLP-dependent aminotransferase family protein [Bacillus]MEC2401084.1 PLP-dependent aminotransferase family protein [Bacillus subtilis]MED4666113.1 PLP-dependent aminotransferase family protein [Bacillus subtilis]NJJ24669.1 PLP-dependent aminotransferase family protein [Bacillus subtilis]QAT56562.1 PLP-dependent aminotransferase family protein [Bacillus subtilis]QFP73109.1 PLP-dependent aminotransferase family protein [Bacillus subtilis]